MADKRDQVLSYALKRFMAIGYSGVLMDDIARGCGISKATLYMLFPSKEALIFACIDTIRNDVGSKVAAVVEDSSLSLVEKLNQFFSPIARLLSFVNIAALDDIQRNVPEVYAQIDQVRRGLILKNIGALLRLGKQTGDVRSDVDETVVAHIIIGTATHIISPDILAEFGMTPDRILESVKSVIIRGCLTEAGVRMLDSFKE